MKIKSFMIAGLLLAMGQLAFGKAKIEKVFVQVAQKKEISDKLTYPARVSPKVSAMVLSESQGVISTLDFNLGDRIAKNKTIAKVTHSDPVYEYRPFRIKAPVSGVISKIFTNVGSQIKKGEKVALITNPKSSKLLIEVAVKDISSFKKGMRGLFKSRSTENKYKVKVTGISPLIDSATGTATAELEFTDRKARKVLPGTIGKVIFKTNIHKGFLFPQKVLTYKGNQAQVRIVSPENKVSRINVKLGAKRRGKIEILTGVKKGDYLIERASGFIKDGAIVAIQNLPKKKTKAKKK
jgi:multidrug efflux pump subunit AcrA (membrane-fusion protein)